MAASHVYTFNVQMTCGGCSGAVSRVLTKMDGLQVKKVEWESKEVIAESETGEPSFDDVLAKIQKTGKKVNWGEDNGERRYSADEAAEPTKATQGP